MKLFIWSVAEGYLLKEEIRAYTGLAYTVKAQWCKDKYRYKKIKEKPGVNELCPAQTQHFGFIKIAQQFCCCCALKI